MRTNSVQVRAHWKNKKKKKKKKKKKEEEAKNQTLNQKSKQTI